MGVVCEHCGVRGWPENLVCCFKCSNAYVHCYCFEDASMIFKGDAEWKCPDCLPKPAKLLPSRRSKRISSEHIKRSNCRMQLFKKTNHRMRLKSLNGRKGVTCALAQEKSLKCNGISSAGGAEIESHPSSVLAQENSPKCNVTASAEAAELPPCSVVSQEESLNCNGNSQAVVVDLPSAVDSRDCNPSDDRCSVNTEMRDPGSVIRGDKGSDTKEKTPLVLVDDYVSQVISLSKEGSSVMLNNNGYVPLQPVKEPIEKGLRCNGNTLAEGAKLPLAVSRDCNLLNDGNSGNIKVRDPSSVVIHHVENRSVPKEKASSVLVDSHVSRVTSVSKDGASVLLNDDSYIPTAPVKEPIWTGCLSIYNEGFQTVDGVAAHLSNRVGLKVHEEASLLPVDLHCDILPKAKLWPKRFQLQRPTDDDIALYLFPETERAEKNFRNLVTKMRIHGLALRCVVENAELLVFTSLELPVDFWRFLGNHYLWGVFRAKQASRPSSVASQ